MNHFPQLDHQLKQLRLTGMLQSLEARNRQALEARMAYSEFLDTLVSDEVAYSMQIGKATGNYKRRLKMLAKATLLIIDDFGLKPLRAPEDEDLHDIIAERYENTSTIVTSNLDFNEWDQAFPSNPLFASATLDRLQHDACCLVLEGQSYRTPKVAPKLTLQTAQKKGKINRQLTHSKSPKLLKKSGS